MYPRLSLLIAVPFLVAGLAIIGEYAGFDLWLARHFYDPVSEQWRYGSLFLTTTVMHDGATDFMILIAVTNLLAIPASYFSGALAPYRRDIAFVLVAALTGVLIVGGLKTVTHIYSPWALAIFGGDKPYVRLLDVVPPGAAIGHAFPGGHSSGGFAYLSLYFAATIRASRYRRYALVFPAVMGLGFAVTQEVRGAHFPSHDLFSFSICWLSALLWSFVFYGRHCFETRKV